MTAATSPACTSSTAWAAAALWLEAFTIATPSRLNPLAAATALMRSASPTRIGVIKRARALASAPPREFSSSGATTAVAIGGRLRQAAIRRS